MELIEFAKRYFDGNIPNYQLEMLKTLQEKDGNLYISLGRRFEKEFVLKIYRDWIDSKSN